MNRAACGPTSESKSPVTTVTSPRRTHKTRRDDRRRAADDLDNMDALPAEKQGTKANKYVLQARSDYASILVASDVAGAAQNAGVGPNDCMLRNSIDSSTNDGVAWETGPPVLAGGALSDRGRTLAWEENTAAGVYTENQESEDVKNLHADEAEENECGLNA